MIRVVLVLALLLGGMSGVRAEANQAAAPSAQQPTRATSPAPDTRIPDGPVLSVLIRRTLLTLNDANLTGNYTVLRDLAAPGFQSANDAARLAVIFTNLRERKIDLSPIIYFDPKLVRAPQIDANGMLRVSGFIPTEPEQVNFDLLFQLVDGRWRLFGLAVNTSPTAATAMPSAAPATPAAQPASPQSASPRPASSAPQPAPKAATATAPVKPAKKKK